MSTTRDEALIDLQDQQRAAPDLGWAQQRVFCTLYESATPVDVLGADG